MYTYKLNYTAMPSLMETSETIRFKFNVVKFSNIGLILYVTIEDHTISATFFLFHQDVLTSRFDII